jgi:hypothetical protein
LRIRLEGIDIQPDCLAIAPETCRKDRRWAELWSEIVIRKKFEVPRTQLLGELQALLIDCAGTSPAAWAHYSQWRSVRQATPYLKNSWRSQKVSCNCIKERWIRVTEKCLYGNRTKKCVIAFPLLFLSRQPAIPVTHIDSRDWSSVVFERTSKAIASTATLDSISTSPENTLTTHNSSKRSTHSNTLSTQIRSRHHESWVVCLPNK